MPPPPELRPAQQTRRFTVRLSAELARDLSECSSRLGVSGAAIMRGAVLSLRARPGRLSAEDAKDPGNATEFLAFRMDPETKSAAGSFPDLGRGEAVRRALVLAVRHIHENNYRVIWPLEL